MLRNLFFLGAVFMLAYSCTTTTKQAQETTLPEPQMDVVVKHKAPQHVLAKNLENVASWRTLKTIDSFLVKYRNIAPNDALSNAVELRDLTKQLQDSVIPESFNTPSLRARINIFRNEVLRLTDIIDIKKIEPNAVNLQIDKTLQAYSALTTKINTVVAKQNFDNEITVDVSYIGLDTTRIDSLSKQAIDLKMKASKLKKKPLSKSKQ